VTSIPPHAAGCRPSTQLGLLPAARLLLLVSFRSAALALAFCIGVTSCGDDDDGRASAQIVDCDGDCVECPDHCTLECPGTAGCEATLGDDSQGVCNGTGFCDVTCKGDCSFDCPGTSKCLLRCTAGYECRITSCGGPASVTKCPDGALACRTDCPS
jgi:hypothetical protein